MAKKKLPRAERTEPMMTQPSGSDRNAAMPMLPTMPHARDDTRDLPAPVPPPQKKPPTEAEAARAERAQVTRRKSLRRQRAAQKS